MKMKLVAALAAILSLPFIVGCAATGYGQSTKGGPNNRLTQQQILLVSGPEKAKELSKLMLNAEKYRQDASHAWKVTYANDEVGGDGFHAPLFQLRLVNPKDPSEKLFIEVGRSNACRSDYGQLDVDDVVKFDYNSQIEDNADIYDPVSNPEANFLCPAAKRITLASYR